jgi:hypothetical protein
VLLASEVVIVRTKKSRPKSARVSGRSEIAPGSKVRAEADAKIERAIERVHICQQKLDRKVLHGPYGKQQMVETIYGAAADLRRHRLADVIKRRSMKRLGADDTAFDLVEALINLARPATHPAVVANWTNATHFAEEHHVRPWTLYREEFAHQDAVEEDEPYGPSMVSKRIRFKMPEGMRGLYD